MVEPPIWMSMLCASFMTFVVLGVIYLLYLTITEGPWEDRSLPEPRNDPDYPVKREPR